MAEARSDNISKWVSGRHKGKLPCLPCSKRGKRSDAVIYCPDCDEIQCSDCAKDHQTLIVLGHHITMDIKEWQETNDFMHLASISKCEEHGLEYFFYCELDDMLCCNLCRDQFHQPCRVLKLSDMTYPSKGSENKDTESKMKELLHEASRISVESVQLKDRTAFKISKFSEALDKMRKKMVEVFDKYEESVLAEAEQYKESQNTSLDEVKCSASDVANDIQNTLDCMKNFPTSMTPSQRFVYEKKMAEVFKKYEKVVQSKNKMLRSFNDDVKSEFSVSPQDVLTLLADEIGSLQTETDVKDSDEFLETKAAQLRLVESVSCISDRDVLNPIYLGIDFLRNDRLALADYKNKKCVIMSSSLKVIGEKHLRYAPHDLLVFGTDEMLVSSGEQKFIDYFSVDAANSLIHKKRISTPYPCDSLSVISERCFTIGVAERDIPVFKLTDFRDFSHFNLQFDRDLYRLGETKCVNLPRLEILVITDKVTNTVTLIDTRSGEKTYVKEKCINQPRCAVVGKDESIFVCCQASCCLVQISPSGEIMSYTKLKMNSPYSMGISQDKNKIAIANNHLDGCKVQIFELIY